MNDSRIIQSLAAEYAELANTPENEQIKRRYGDLNSMRPVRPIVLIDEVPWHEFADFDEIRVLSVDPLAREVETFLRRKLFQHRYFRGDQYLEPYYPLRRPVTVEGMGIEIEEDVAVTDVSNEIVSHHYHDQLKTVEDLERLQTPQVTLDTDREDQMAQRASELLGNSLDVKLVGTALHFHPWDTIAEWRGVQNLLIDLLDRPELCHALMEKLTRIQIDIADQMVSFNLLEPNPPLVHCTAGFADELEMKDKPVTRANVWGRGAAQIFGEVSREMHDEFDLRYQKRYLKGFGLSYYGCCEPLHTKIDLLEQLPRLRKISITPWADVDTAAECMAGKYVLSRKPNPTNVAMRTDETLVRDEIRQTLEACKRYDLVCEFVLKDISTVGHKLDNLVTWERTARQVIDEFE